jgi:hypothetical protein
LIDSEIAILIKLSEPQSGVPVSLNRLFGYRNKAKVNRYCIREIFAKEQAYLKAFGAVKEFHFPARTS